MGLFGRRAIIFAWIFILLSLGGQTLQAYEVSGRVRIEPPYPAPETIKVRKKIQDSCAAEQLSQSLLVSSDGGVANAVLWLAGNFDTPAKTVEQPSVLNQRQCHFEPHVVLVSPGNILEVYNSDPLAHDVRAFREAQMLFRFEMDPEDKPEKRRFEKPGIYTIRCGLHPWMHAFAVQAEHALYAVSDPQGNFSFQNVPEGKHKVHIWHETLGEVNVPLEISESIKGFDYVFKKT